ncbi:MAG: NAD(+) synthase [Clostridia bacterium]|nr:NAD(+) synthase [Clostridia bacterium]
MQHGFIKVAAATPAIRVADSARNTAACVSLAHAAAGQGVKLLVFPELCLTGATCGDLFSHERSVSGARDALIAYAAETADLDLVSVVGLPVAIGDKLYDCAAVVCGGTVLGLVPKTNLTPAERRTFSAPPAEVLVTDILGDGSFVQMGTKQFFVCSSLPSLRFAVEVGQDRNAATPPSMQAVSAGAVMICNPSATPEVMGAEQSRVLIATARSASSRCGYILAEAGEGESTTDSVYGGHHLICEGGEVLAEVKPFAGSEMTVTELDLERLIHDRRVSSFDVSACGHCIENYFDLCVEETELTRPINPHPFLPVDPAYRASHCERILTIQANGLKKRITAAWAQKIVLGISGGLDSTLALLVMVRAMDLLNRPRTDIIAVTMPCFGTTSRTKNNATTLCEELGVDFRTVNIFDSVNQHFKDIGHDPAVRDVTYENAQARERTQVIMDIANDEGGMVVGTGDLSELALGWATYNGDHMSMYSVNGGVPKTLVRELTAYAAASEMEKGNTKLAEALYDILGTPVSPELLPADGEGKIAQKTEDLVGPYELHDFFLYHLLRYGFTPSKLFRMARHTLGETYDDATILKWLETFHRRFFTQQFKRSCLPDGPAVFEVGVSPRGGWAMPSDAVSSLWMEEIRELKEEYL